MKNVLILLFLPNFILGVTNKGCFFHLGQSGWRKIQEFGLASQYGTDEHLSLMLRHLFALAFLPPDEIPTAFDTLKTEMPRTLIMLYNGLRTIMSIEKYDE